MHVGVPTQNGRTQITPSRWLAQRLRMNGWQLPSDVLHRRNAEQVDPQQVDPQQGDDPKPAVLVLDEWDRYWTNEEERLLSVLLTLAIDSSNSGKYVVIYNTSNASLAKSIIHLNGGVKVSMINGFSGYDVRDYKWDHDQVTAALMNFKDIEFGGKDKTRLFSLAVQAGTPGFLQKAIQKVPFDKLEKEALDLAEAWEIGASILRRKTKS